MPWPTDMPLPRMEGYSYTIPTVLRRTNFADGNRWQRAPVGGLRRQFTASYDVDVDQLRALMEFIHEQGFGESPIGPGGELPTPDWWISVPLLSGESTTGAVTNHIVRIIADPKIQRGEGADYFLVELQFEDQGPPSFVSWPPA